MPAILDDDLSFQSIPDDESDYDEFEENAPPNKTKKATTKAKAPAKPTAKKTAAKKTTTKKAATKKTTTKTPQATIELSDSEDDDFNMDTRDDTSAENTSSSSSSGSSGKKKTVEEIYQKKSQLEHILLRPDTYIGSVERVKQEMYILNSETKRIVQKNISFTPGLFKIFDEIIVNAADNKQRDSNMDLLAVEVDGPANTISVKNNGKGIPVVMHKEHNCYVPTLIFGHLLTGSNFDDDEKKTTGGRNGYGAKLANIFSTEFIIECADVTNGVKLTQHFRDNMTITEKPVIKKLNKTETKAGDFVKITFKPDLHRFKMTHLDEDIVGLFSKRAYDIAGSMASRVGKRLNVTLNGEKIPVKNFEQYLKLYDGVAAPVAYEKVNERWEVGVGTSEGSFQQVSFVNAICTSKGGGHTEHIANQIANGLTSILKKKTKGGSEVKKNQISNHLCVFVNCLVENPTFDSQTKEFLTTRPKSFGSSCDLSSSFLKKVEKSEIVQNILAYSKFKDNQALKKAGGKKKTKLTGIAKLDDANFAGSAKSKNCTLIITEGDSAKSLAMSGISVVGRDYYGVFPLKGKPLNVREATHAQIMKNEEIKNVVEILGLKFGVTYDETNIKTLRYGHLMIMADQDHDGSHIKGLVINFIHHFWPSLLDVKGFLQQFITPIVKATRGKRSHTFFTIPEYENWRENMGERGLKGYSIKYYKGLGTSTSVEAKEYFANLDLHEVNFSGLSEDIKPALNNRVDSEDDDMVVPSAVVPDSPISGSDLIEMAFKKNRVEDRKTWLNNLKKGTFMNYSQAQENGVAYSDFINKELILFSQADNQRSIPHIYDGFKPSQRKVLFSCFKRKLKNEIKVAQLAGYVSEHSAYHHGEMSLTGSIVNMAQSFCGSNNINLLTPSGQFGTRRMGGKDAASPRYIFTRLEKITRTIFHPDDDALLSYLSDDGLSIEPEFYMPVIPMILVNGSDGIGTGWSSFVPNYCPRQIMSNLRKLINGDEIEEMMPSYSGFSGEVIPETGTRQGNFIVKGRIERLDDTTLEITELPVKVWTQNYKQFIESMMISTGKTEPDIKDFKEDHTDATVSFTITATKEKIDSFEKAKDGLYGKFKLTGKIHTTNMNLFDEKGRIIKYQTPEDIMTSFFGARLDFYGQRKDHLLTIMRRDLQILSNKARFVEEVCKGDLIINNRKRKEILHELEERGYELFDTKKDKDKDKESSSSSESEESLEESASDAELARGYEYLLGMKIWNLTFEKVEQLRQQLRDKEAAVIELEATPPSKIWENDLDAIEEALNERDEEFEMNAEDERKAQKKNTARRVKKAAKTKEEAKKKKKKKDEWDSDLEDDEDSLDGRNLSLESEDEDDFVVKKAPKKAAVKKAKPAARKIPETVSSKDVTSESSSNSKLSDRSDVEVLSDDVAQRLTMSPTKKKPPQPKPSLLASIDDFLSETSSPSKRKIGVCLSPLTPTKESTDESSDALVESPEKKVVPKKGEPKKKPAKRAKPAAKPAAKPKAKAGRKKKEVVNIESSDEEDFIAESGDDKSVEEEVVAAAPSRARSTRTRQTKTKYTVDLEDSDDLVESDEESDFE